MIDNMIDNMSIVMVTYRCDNDMIIVHANMIIVHVDMMSVHVAMMVVHVDMKRVRFCCMCCMCCMT